jgi:hypothetical protein
MRRKANKNTNSKDCQTCTSGQMGAIGRVPARSSKRLIFGPIIFRTLAIFPPEPVCVADERTQ